MAAAPGRRYYYNGHVYSSDLGKGFDVLKITDADLRKAAR